MAIKLHTLASVTVTTAGTRVQITNNLGLAASSIIISASTDNVGKIYVGDNSVTNLNGTELEAGDSIQISGDNIRGIAEELFLSDIYIDSETNNNVAKIQYLKRR